MPRSKYRPDYFALYPKTKISEKVLAALKQSDRKMEYHEYDLKIETWKIDQAAQTAECFQSREDSYDRLLAEEKQFRQTGESLEDLVIKAELIALMMECFGKLDEDDRNLLRALFFDEVSQRDLSEKYNITQPAIKKRKDKVLDKLKKLMKI